MRFSAFIGTASVGVVALATLAAVRQSDRLVGQSVVVVKGGLASGVVLGQRWPSLASEIRFQRPTVSQTPAKLMARSATWWRPAVGDTWQWQLVGTIRTDHNASIYDVDLFDTKDGTLKSLRSSGRKIMCYFSAGSAENWRDDYGKFNDGDKGAALDGWAGERWVNVRSENVRSIMKGRLDLAVTRGCDGVEPDNVDGYANSNGLSVTASDQLDYNRFLATEAHRRGLGIALKNDLDQIPALVASFDLAVNEQCNQYAECDALRPFVDAGKPVLNAEYAAKYRKNTSGARDKLCKDSRSAKIRTLVLPLNLDGTYRFSCDS